MGSDDQRIVKGLNEIASVLRCSPEEVRYHVRNSGLPVARKSATGVYRSTTKLLVEWMEGQATNALMENATLANNPLMEPDDG